MAKFVDVYLEVESSFELTEIVELKTFQKFWEQVDVQNAYEPDWEQHVERGIREIYHQVWEAMMREAGIKVPRNLVECTCNDCGNGMEVFYDKANDYYICQECLDKEENELSEEEDAEEDDECLTALNNARFEED